VDATGRSSVVGGIGGGVSCVKAEAELPSAGSGQPPQKECRNTGSLRDETSERENKRKSVGRVGD